ncbi:MAG: hypothetical protein EA400_04755 [Chromatiaceae bacterium]|nr:MAG: hypothetical protein EA400_04755 [Chromatiaceae bacterium]
MPEFTLPLALFNFLPVLFGALAFALLARLVQRRAPSLAWLGWMGSVLIVFGGLAKALWKLLMAIGGVDLTWLSAALFPLLGPGFMLLAAGVWGALRAAPGVRPGPLAARVALLVILGAVGVAALRTWGLGVERGWFLPLLILTTLGNLSLSSLLILAAVRRRLWAAATLFALNLAMLFALPPIAIMASRSLAIHWLEQSLTALGTAGFALATWWLAGALAASSATALNRSPARRGAGR